MKKIDNIFLVDDDEITNHLHQQLLDYLDIRATIKVANNGEDALDLLEQELSSKKKKRKETLILLDINMPRMNGFEFLEKFNESYKRTYPNVHIALLSSSTNKKDKEKASRYDIEGYLEKPLTEEKLQSLIDKLVDKDE
jgi:CheY-like chemotaxis protein